jgi:hypothetical protein
VAAVGSDVERGDAGAASPVTRRAGLALARSFKIIDPTLRNPQPYDWERAFKLFALLL